MLQNLWRTIGTIIREDKWTLFILYLNQWPNACHQEGQLDIVHITLESMAQCLSSGRTTGHCSYYTWINGTMSVIREDNWTLFILHMNQFLSSSMTIGHYSYDTWINGTMLVSYNSGWNSIYSQWKNDRRTNIIDCSILVKVSRNLKFDICLVQFLHMLVVNMELCEHFILQTPGRTICDILIGHWLSLDKDTTSYIFFLQ